MMTKSELINMVGEKSGLTKKDTTRVIEAAIDTLTQALSKGETVQLIGFGSFEVHSREARKGRNPRTGAELKISARKVPVFRAGKALKDAVAR